MKVDINKIITIFDGSLKIVDDELKCYWLTFKRKDNLSIDFMISLIEKQSVSVIVSPDDDNVSIAAIHLEHCEEINILDEQEKYLEILNDNGRCLFSLIGDPIINYTEYQE